MDEAEIRSLKSKLKEHYHNRDFTPKPDLANRLGVVGFWLMTLILFFTAVWLLIPVLFDSTTGFYLTLFCIFLLIEHLLNWILIKRNGCNIGLGKTDGRYADNTLKEGWFTCVKCQKDAPPRSHHCRLCRVCIPKQDHHCFFAGTCIGHNNQRYFIVSLTYTIIAASFSLYLIFSYIDLVSPFADTWPSYLPVVSLWRWLSGSVRTDHFLLLTLAFVTMVFLGGALMYMFLQVLVVQSGQTTWEAGRGISRYRMNTVDHIRAIFGHYWIINFVIPLPTEQSVDGHNWPRYKSLKGH